MKNARRLLWGRRMRLAVLTLAMVLTMGLAVEDFSFVSHAESKGKITASSSVNIRKEPSSSSAALGSAEKDAAVDVRGIVTASDGSTWYQVFVNADTLGYIRSDLVQITDGTTPPAVEATTGTQTGGNTAAGGTTSENTAGVTAVEPLSATVVNGQKVRVRSSASTNSSIVTSVQSGMALTITGQANGSDGKVWYQVEFIADGANVVGFIRSDYVSLSGEVVPAGTGNSEEPAQEPQVPVEEAPSEITKTWDTQLQGDEWYLLNLETGNQYGIDKLFDGVKTNGDLYETSQKTVKSQKIVIIILVILLFVFAAVATMLFLKIKDMADSAYISEVEKETLRKRESSSRNKQKAVHTVGPDKKPAGKQMPDKTGAQQGARPSGTRPAGAQQGTRPAGAQQGTRPAGAQQGTRPAGAQQSARSAGAQQETRPAGAQQGTRPAGAQQGTRPMGTQQQGTRPSGAQQGSRSAGMQVQDVQTQRPRPSSPKHQGGRPMPDQTVDSQQDPGWKSKNFMADDDEFEFEFLHWDGEDEQ